MRKDRLAIIGIVGLPPSYGGFETLADCILDELSKKYEVEVYCSSQHYKYKSDLYRKAKLKYVQLKANGWQSFFYDAYCIWDAIVGQRKILLLGVSGAWVLPFLKRKDRMNITVNIDGIEWKRRKWNLIVRLLLKKLESMAVKYCGNVIADNEAVNNYIKDKYGVEPVLIEYGAKQSSVIEDGVRGLYYLTICRIEPENNVEMIINAFNGRSERLVIVGNWMNSNYSKRLYRKSCTSNIEKTGPMYDAIELDKLRRNASVYLHGHSAGGTNPSLVEAMAYSLPILAFDVGFNRFTTENKARYFKNEMELANTINTMKEEEMLKNGRDMFEISERRYRWDVISRKYVSILEKNTGGDE